MKICGSCQQAKSVEFFSWRNKSKGTRQSICKSCVSARDAKKYAEGGRKGSTIEQARAIRQRNREYIVSILEKSSCVDCGESDMVVLEFDHLSDKKHNIASMGSHSIEALQEEIDKCEIVCANCHRRRTYSRMNNCYRIMA